MGSKMKVIRTLYFMGIGVALGTALFRVWPGNNNLKVLAVCLLLILISALEDD
jgi:putative copper export protein